MPSSRRNVPAERSFPGVVHMRMGIALWGLALAFGVPGYPQQPSRKRQQAEPDGRKKLDAAARKKLSEIFREYLTAEFEKRLELLQKVEEIDEQYAITKADIDQHLALLSNLDAQGPKLTGNTFSQHPKYSRGKMIVSGGGPGQPLWISLHGGGAGVGDPSQAPPVSAPGVVIRPEAFEKLDTAWNQEINELYVLEIIHAAKRTFRVDTNRIYVVGHSMGGWGSWWLGTNYADQFAGVGPMAGGISPEQVVCNLKNTAIWFYHSTDDPRVKPDADQRAAKILEELKKKFGPYDFVYKEYNNIGHGYPTEGTGPIFQFLAKHTRNPYPKMVIFNPFRPYNRLLHWIKVPNLDKNSWYRTGRIVAKVEKDNRIAIEEGQGELEVLIHEKMGVNLAREVVVTRGGGEKFRGKVNLSLAALLESFGENRDPNHYYYARIRVPQ